MIEEIGNDFFTTPSSEKVWKIILNIVMFTYIYYQILLKCDHEGDMRIISIDSDIPYTRLKEILEEKFEISRATIAYVDEDQDKITIDSKETLQKAIAKYKSEGAKALKVSSSSFPFLIVIHSLLVKHYYNTIYPTNIKKSTKPRFFLLVGPTTHS